MSVLQSLENNGILRTVNYENTDYKAIATPVEILISQNVWTQLKTAYKVDSETGGILIGTPAAKGKIEITEAVIMRNDFVGDAAKTGFKFPVKPFWETVNKALSEGKLPFKFHSHPVVVGSQSIGSGSVNLFQKTSNQDRHSSYFALSDGTNKLILPDCLVVSNDVKGSDIRFYVYNGFVQPMSVRRLFESEQISIAVISLGLIALYAVGQKKFFAIGLLILIVILVFIFVRDERLRARITYPENNGILVSIP